MNKNGLAALAAVIVLVAGGFWWKNSATVSGHAIGDHTRRGEALSNPDMPNISTLPGMPDGEEGGGNSPWGAELTYEGFAQIEIPPRTHHGVPDVDNKEWDGGVGVICPEDSPGATGAAGDVLFARIPDAGTAINVGYGKYQCHPIDAPETCESFEFKAEFVAEHQVVLEPHSVNGKEICPNCFEDASLASSHCAYNGSVSSEVNITDENGDKAKILELMESMNPGETIEVSLSVANGGTADVHDDTTPSFSMRSVVKYPTGTLQVYANDFGETDSAEGSWTATTATDVDIEWFVKAHAGNDWGQVAQCPEWDPERFGLNTIVVLTVCID